jgi:hypothetical protein
MSEKPKRPNQPKREPVLVAAGRAPSESKSEQLPKKNGASEAEAPLSEWAAPSAAEEALLLKGIELGLSVEKSCALVGITHERFAEWRKKDPQLEFRIEGVRAKGIESALRELHSIKAEGDTKAITWFLERMDRERYGAQPAVIAAKQNNYYAGSTGEADQILKFIAGQRERMAQARALRSSDPEKAAAIEAETLDWDGDMLDRDEPV